ncbi:endonuclease/exonuclease/phosphatase family precursor [Geofilum rubicundum JCM 15548]|uniref:Endonuclease/exonuclease/phosphatase family n=2 Tax=Geofilum TaxID=1236988 RepID=A0A0E9LY62_9BACT|nr:endonuclease/exonuclease/phosphatase family precursor [Geofilum rubicundum JCM 15548]
MPLISIGFEDEIQNEGIMPVIFRGDGHVSYTEGVSGKALDLSHTSKYRKPVVLAKDHHSNITDYPGITVLLWVRLSPDDFNHYTILSQKDEFEDFEPLGWSLSTGINGSWSWWMSDGIHQTHYRPTPGRQAINDGEWHLLGFSIDFDTQEARLFYDGMNVAVYSLQQEDFRFFEQALFLGADPFSADPVLDTFNGTVDDLTVWSRVLSPGQVDALYQQYKSSKAPLYKNMPDSLTIMNWNIWGGGMREGRFVGVKRVAEIIRSSGADLISMQETFASGPLIADMLGFYFYQRSDGLSVLSRYPLGETYNIYRSRVSGAITVELPEDNRTVFCPVYLSYLPNNGPMIMSGKAVADSVVVREMETRGSEMRYIVWELQSLVDRNDQVPLILAGDFNSGSHLDWTEANRQNRYDLVIDYPATRILDNAGFVDSYRQIYPDEVAHPGFTWSPRFREVLHDRVNFVFYNGSRVAPSWANIIDTHPLGFPSDHGALVVSFKWEK